MAKSIVPTDLEFAVGPHAGRQEWRVLRVNFNASNAEHQARISDALRALVAPRPLVEAPSSEPVNE